MRLPIVGLLALLSTFALADCMLAQSVDGDVLLQVDGALEDGDEVLSTDSSLYDEYSFEGQAGQAVIITVESDEFDTFLFLLDSDGNEIARNDDWNDSPNSTIGYVLPADDTYQVRVSSYNVGGRGLYRTLISTTTVHSSVVVEFRADELLQRGIDQVQVSQFRVALQTWQTALELYRNIGDRAGEGSTLGNLGHVYLNLGQYERAIELHEQHLAIARDIGDQAGKGHALGNLGNAYLSLGQYERAVDLYEQVLTITREIGDRAGEGRALGSLGLAYDSLAQYERAIELYEQQLEITRRIGDRVGEERALGNLGVTYDSLGQYERAIELHNQSLVIAREIGNRAGEGKALGNLGNVYLILGEYHQAIELYEQVLAIAREIEYRAVEGSALRNLGLAYNNLGQYEQAIEFHEHSLEIAREIGDRVGEGNSLGNLGIAYDILGQYQQAIGLFEQQLLITREIRDRAGEGRALGNLGNAYIILGQYQRATDFYEQQLVITREIGDRVGEGNALLNLGIVYNSLGEYRRAIDLYEQQLEITQEIGDRASEGRALSNLGAAYSNLGEYRRAIDLYKQQLEITREIGDRTGEGSTLGRLGNVYLRLSQDERALEFYEQDLEIAREVGNRVGERITLNNLGFFFETQGQPELAIVFYKLSISIGKQINQPLNDPLSRQSYIETVAGTYHRLENLLLEQGRQLETQQALELFKLQELSDYTNEQDLTTELPDLALLPEEEAVINIFNNLVTVNQQLRACNTDNCSISSELQAAKDHTSEQHQLTLEHLTAFIRNGGHIDHPLLRDNFFLAQAKQIISQQPGTILIYPLVLDESLWLLWVTEEGINSQQISNVNQQTLTETISAFRAGLEDRYSDLNVLQTHANQLYKWLIAPVEAAVDNSSRLVLALDRNTRYIPIGALYDGQQYLVEKYDISTILAASLTNAEERAPVGTDNVGVLAAGISKQYENFPALPNVPIELDNIVKEQSNSDDQLGIYSGQQLLDPDFTAQTLQSSLSNNTRFLHIATHGEFVPGNRYSSYLLMGNGEKLPLPEIAALGVVLRGVHLAVLSACQTALGGADEEGLEIAGLGYYFFKSDVDAVMASLWNVNDSSTSQLMQAFYQTLSEGTEANPMTKAEALRIAQLSLLKSNAIGNPDVDRFRRIPKNPDDQPRPESGLAHPYYWAPFILIGNGL